MKVIYLDTASKNSNFSESFHEKKKKRKKMIFALISLGFILNRIHLNFFLKKKVLS